MASSNSSKIASKAPKAKSKPKQSQSQSQSQYEAPVSANFSSSTASSAVVDYDHETYLQLVSGSSPGPPATPIGTASAASAAAATGMNPGKKNKIIPKTANQVYREVCIILFFFFFYMLLLLPMPARVFYSGSRNMVNILSQERTRRLTTRALDPAILDPRGDPSSVDFECAEIQRKKDRLQ